MRLLGGNWNVRAVAGSYFRREWFPVVDSAPKDIFARVRYWDRAATERTDDNDPDASVGLLMSKDHRGRYYIEDRRKLWASPFSVDRAMKACAQQDGPATVIGYMQDPGSAGVKEAQDTARMLDGFEVHYAAATGDKETRAKSISSQCEAGNVSIVRGQWNDDFFRVLENFPTGTHDDDVDALSGAHGLLCSTTTGQYVMVKHNEEPLRANEMISGDRRRGMF